MPEQVRGRVAAAIGGLMSGGMLLSMVAGGLLTSLLNPREVFWLCALVGLSATALLGRRPLVVQGSQDGAGQAPPDLDLVATGTTA